MDMTLKQLGVDRLTVAERLDLIGRIWDTLPDDGGFSPPDWHLRELEVRLAAADAEPEAGTPWETIKARLLSRP
jgi:putative addiction module component (TIGR02574 family)